MPFSADEEEVSQAMFTQPFKKKLKINLYIANEETTKNICVVEVAPNVKEYKDID